MLQAFSCITKKCMKKHTKVPARYLTKFRHENIKAPKSKLVSTDPGDSSNFPNSHKMLQIFSCITKKCMKKPTIVPARYLTKFRHEKIKAPKLKRVSIDPGDFQNFPNCHIMLRIFSCVFKGTQKFSTISQQLLPQNIEISKPKTRISCVLLLLLLLLWL